MRSGAYGILFLLLSAVVIVAVSGCTGAPQGTKATVPADTSKLTMADIDGALATGPVFLEFGAEWCQYCQDEKPIMQNLTKEYGSVTFIHVDSDRNYGLDRSFMMQGVPQMDVIVRKNADGSYQYVGPDGNTTTDRQASRIIGFTGQPDLEKILNTAIAARKTG